MQNAAVSASKCYKHPLISWNIEHYVKLSDILGAAGEGKGDMKIMVCKTAGGPAVTYQLGSICGDGMGFTWLWNSPRRSERLRCSRWTEKACREYFAEAMKNAEVVARELIAKL